jgi:cytochrome P450
MVSVAVYRLFFHPLRAFPGPISYRISVFPRAYHSVAGDLPFHVGKLHEQYGPIVRISPHELAFSDPQAWKDIYGHRGAGQEEFPKYAKFYRPLGNMPPSIISVASREEHGLIRRQVAHGFSDRSLRGQEPIIGAYVNLLIKRLHANAEGGTEPLNMRNWLNWATFDIIGDLGFGSSFGCLESSGYHPWVSLITDTIRTGARLGALRAVGLGFLVQFLGKFGFLKKRDAHRALVNEKLEQRLELGAERPDFVEGLIKEKDGFVSYPGGYRL